MSKYNMRWSERNLLIGVAVALSKIGGERIDATEFINTKFSATLDLQKMHDKQPSLYGTILRDFKRGYRTSADGSLVTALEREYLGSHNSEWAMSYLGPSEMVVYLPHEAMIEFNNAVIGINALMTHRLDVRMLTNTSTKVCSPVGERESKRKSGYGTRSVPVINHDALKQAKVLAIKALSACADRREEIVQSWLDHVPAVLTMKEKL